MSELFRSLCLLWNFLLQNLKLKKKKNSADVHWNVWKSIKILYVQNYVFEKNDFKWEISSHLNFGPNFIFGNCFMVF